MSVEDYAAAKGVPKALLERMLTCQQGDPALMANLEVLSEKLGLPAAHLLSSNLSHGGEQAPDHLLARQLGRLIADFVDYDEAGRFEVTALAQELAEEHLRNVGRMSQLAKPSSNS